MKVFCEISIFLLFLACSAILLDGKEDPQRKVFDRVPIFSEIDATSVIKGALNQCKARCQSSKSFATAPSNSPSISNWCVCVTEESPFSHGLVSVPGAILYEKIENQVGLSQFLIIDALPVGGFLYSEKPVSLKQCSLSCVSAAHTRCQAFEYSVISQECNLYSQSHIQNGTDIKPRENDGQRAMYFEYMNFVLRSYSAEWSRLINGTFLNSSKNTNANECGRKCYGQCVGFNYYSDQLKCDMFSTLNVTTKSNKNVINFQKQAISSNARNAELKESDEMNRTEGVKNETKQIYLNSINSTFTVNYTNLQEKPVLIILQIKNTDAKGRLSIQLSQVQLGIDSEEHCSTGILNVQAGWHSNFSFCNYKSSEPDIISNASDAEIAISTSNISIPNSFAALQQNVHLTISALADVKMNVTKVLQDTVIQSPNISGNYLPNLNYKWSIQANDGMIPILDFVSFKLARFRFAGIESCDNDRLYLDYGNASNPLCGHLEQDNLPKQLLSPFKNFTLHFKTDDRYEDTGFEIRVTMLKEFPCAAKGATSVTTSGILFHLSKINENRTCDWILNHSFDVTIKFCRNLWVKNTPNGHFENYNCSSTNYLHLEVNSTIRWKSGEEDSWLVAFVNDIQQNSTTTSPRPTSTMHSIPSISSTTAVPLPTSTTSGRSSTSSRRPISTTHSVPTNSSTSGPQPTTSTSRQSTIIESSTSPSIATTSSMQNTTSTASQNKPLIIGLSITAFVLLVGVVTSAIYIYKRRQYRDRTLSQEVLPSTSTLEINCHDYYAEQLEAEPT